MESLTQKIGEDFLVNELTAGTQYGASVALLPDGGFVVAWQTEDTTQDGSSDAIKARVFAADGSPAGDEFLVNTQGQLYQFGPEVKGLANGGFVISWNTVDSAQDGSDNAIKARVFNASGQPIAGEFLVNEETFGDQSGLAIAVLPGGGFIMTWHTSSISPTDLRDGLKGRIFDANGAPAGPEFLIDNSGSVYSKPSVTILDTDRFIVSWSGSDSNGVGITARIFDMAGQPLGGEFVINEEMDGNQWAPTIATLTEGGFAVTWYTADTTQDGSGYAIKARVFDGSGKPVSDEFLVNTNAELDQYYPVITSLPDGGFAIAWFNGDPPANARVFRADGTPEGDQFVLNALGSGGSSPSLAGRADGTLVAAWTGLGTTGGDDNGSPGIRAAIFDLSLAPTAHRDGSLTKAGEALSLSTAGLLANDSDLDGDSLTITGISNASHGTVSRDGTTIHFTPAAGFTGEAGFDYTVSDGKGETDTAHASVFVLPETLPSDWRLLAADGFKGEIGGNGAVTGNSGYQEIGVLDLAGAILFDPSFNRGGDVIRLGGESATWNVVQSGSSAMLLRGETVVIIPLGITPSKLVFDDGWLNLRYDTAAGSPKIGTQAFSTSVAPITATANTLELPDNSDADAVSKLFLASHRDVALDGRYAIIGTAGAERIDFIGGRLQLDPSFNRGGDTLAVDDPAFEFSAIRIGSSVKLAHLDGSEVLIPFGTAGMTIGFNGDERELYFDTTLGAILLGSQVIGASAVTLIA